MVKGYTTTSHERHYEYTIRDHAFDGISFVVGGGLVLPGQLFVQSVPNVLRVTCTQY